VRLNSIIAVSAFLPVFALASFTQDSFPRPRLISVTGTAEVNVAPDEVALSLGVESRDKDLSIAKAQHDGHINEVAGRGPQRRR